MKIFAVVLFALISPASLGQNTFSLGAKLAYGTSAFPMDVILESGGYTYLAKSGATLSIGITGRYMIGDLIGIESGVWINHYSYYRGNGFYNRNVLWKSAANFEVANFQMPIILNYQIKLPRQPFRYFLFSAGTSIDWCVSYLHEGTSYPIPPRASQNVLAILKVGRERPKGNKFEIGLEAQYSLKQFQVAHYRELGYEYKVLSRLNMLALNVTYFFLKRERVGRMS